MNTGDTAWLLVSAALVLFMVPGLALFYGGLVAEKNVVAMMAKSFAAIGVIGILWAVVGYSLAFGPDHWGVIGGFSHVLLRGVGASPSSFAPHVPASLFMAYQMMFAIITPALITGAFTARMHFRGYLVFIGLWSLIVYCPFAHWVWGGGFLGPDGVGAVDFAGGAVVHELAGAAALVTVLFLGPRHYTDRPHNVPMVLLGAGILWFGWFGFNAGSAGAATPVAAAALVNTQLAACTGMIAWMTVEWIRNRKPTGIGLVTGAVAGLAAVTPASGYVPSWAALIIGLAAGVICYGAVQLKSLFHYDDALDVVGVHMVAGIIGVVLIGVFASLAVNPAGVASGWTQLGRQTVLAIVALAYSFVLTWIVLWITHKVVGLKVGPGEQAEGLDLGEHGEVGYQLSPQSVADTVARLTELVTAKGMKLFAVIDQSAEARQVGLDLRDTVLVIFGSPAAGTPVMVTSPLAALDMPLKVLIWDNAGQTNVTYYAPAALATRHHLSADMAAKLAGIDPLTDALIAP